MLTTKEKADLKLEGYIKQRGDNDFFSMRIVSDAGNMTSEDMMLLSKIASKYGRGYMSFTTRLCVEIPWIRYEDINNIREELKRANLVSGGTGNKLRPLVACKGTVCVHGIFDTQDVCRRLYDKYFLEETPAKFKIGLVGCPNNCAKASLNDLGIIGQVVPEANDTKCTGCGMCAKSCKMGAIRIDNSRAIIDYDKCINCGDCISACRMKAIDIKKRGLAIFVGGKFGKRYRLGTRLDGLIDVEDAEKITGDIIEFYRKYAMEKERFGDMLDRVGIQKLEEAIFGEK